MKLLSPKCAAEHLGGTHPLSVKTLEKWRHTGYGPEYIKLGHTVRYELAKLDEWLEGQRRKNTSEYGAGFNQGGEV